MSCDLDDEWALFECLFHRPEFAPFLAESPVTFRRSGLTDAVALLSAVTERPQWDCDPDEPDHVSYAMFAHTLFCEAITRMETGQAVATVRQVMEAIKSLPRQQKYIYPDKYPLKLLEYVETGTWPDPLTPNTR